MKSSFLLLLQRHVPVTGLVRTHFDVVHAEDVAAIVHVLFQVLLQILEDQRQGFLRVDDIVQRHCKRPKTKKRQQ